MDEELIEEEEYTEDSLAERVRTLRERLHACRTERQEYLTGWQRARADFVNARREEAAAHEEIVRYAEERLLKELIGFADTFARALAGRSASDPFMQGFTQLHRQLLGLLTEHGVSTIPAQGEQFDTHLHEAVASVPVATKKEDGIIIEEVERGYLHHDKVLKPSKVTVGAYNTDNS